MSTHNRAIAIVGLGYVGLPLAIALSNHKQLIAFDKNRARIEELKRGYDRTKENDESALKSSNILFTDNPSELNKADLFIVAVPTPIDQHKQPDLTLLEKASEMIGKNMPQNSIIVYESTVFPGATEDICIPILEEASGFKNKIDFAVGYSPERINPGDKEHRLENIVKVISAQDEVTLDIIELVYKSVVKAGIYRAPNIKTAEAAKIIENTQRDINIALMNELAMIFNKMNIDTNEVLNAASTKWNFIDFKPGLVGGHCIGVDPYYLTFQAELYGHQPTMILSGRKINDSMGKHIAQQAIKHMIKSHQTIKNSTIGILGFTFKGNCPDVRNSKVIDIITELHSYGIDTIIHDPIADKEQTKQQYGIDLSPPEALKNLNALIIAVEHDCFRQISPLEYTKMLTSPYVIIDVKGLLSLSECKNSDINLWRL